MISNILFAQTDRTITEKKVMQVSENLRLRETESISSNILTTLKANSPVQIIQIGKSDVIDGIKSNWVKVKLLPGARDLRDYNICLAFYREGGWCFGGYLEVPKDSTYWLLADQECTSMLTQAVKEKSFEKLQAYIDYAYFCGWYRYYYEDDGFSLYNPISMAIQYDWQDEVYGKTIIQRHGKMMLVQNPPAYSLTTEELDRIYALPYMRTYHPSYEAQGGVPGIEEVRFSITHNRGCFGYCNFCSIALHQGRRVTVRSEESVLAEAERITKMPDFKGYIHDVGGPTANFRHSSCNKQLSKGLCMGKKCLAPTPCPALKVDHSEYLAMLRKIRAVKGVKRVFIRSGIRYDYLMEDKDDEFMRELIKHHVSGQLKVAPEHCSAVVLDKMGKPHIEAYKRFQKRFYEVTKGIGKEQYLVPYLMSSHPGSTLREAVDLALFLKENKIRPEQVQDFYPTPGTISTAMFYTELDPYTMEKVYVPKTPKEKAMQRALLQYFRPQNKEIVLEALKQAGRRDLIGKSPKCLVDSDEPNNRKGGEKSWQAKGKSPQRSQNRQQAGRKESTTKRKSRRK